MPKNITRRKRMNRRRPVRKGRKGKKGPKQVQQALAMNSISSKTFRCVKTQLNAQQSSVVGGGTVSLVSAFTAVNIPDFLNYAVVFNQYRINKIHLTFRLKDVSGTASLSNDQMPTIWIRYNYDSVNMTPSTPSANVIFNLQKLPNVKQVTFTPNKTQFTYTLVPLTSSPVYLSSLATGYKMNRKLFIDVAYNNVPHYGIHYYVDNLPSGLRLDMDITTDFTMRYVV